MAEKGQSPFYPGRPVPGELFIGRDAQIQHILTRGVGQVECGKPVTMFVQGEYGIGKSSIARYVHFLAAEQHGLLPIYVGLANAKHKEDLLAKRRQVIAAPHETVALPGDEIELLRPGARGDSS